MAQQQQQQQQQPADSRFLLSPFIQEPQCELYFSRNSSPCCYPFALFHLRMGDGAGAGCSAWCLRGHPGFLLHAEMLDFYISLWQAKRITAVCYECGWLEMVREDRGSLAIVFCCDSAVHANSEGGFCLVQHLATSGQFLGNARMEIRCNNPFHNLGSRLWENSGAVTLQTVVNVDDSKDRAAARPVQ